MRRNRSKVSKLSKASDAKKCPVQKPKIPRLSKLTSESQINQAIDCIGDNTDDSQKSDVMGAENSGVNDLAENLIVISAPSFPTTIEINDVANLPGSATCNKKKLTTGRQWDIVWEDFECTVDQAKKLTQAICKYCRKQVSAQAPRLRNHVEGCRMKLRATNAERKSNCVNNNSAPESETAPEPGSSTSANSEPSVTSSLPTHRKQTSMKNFTKTISPEVKQSLDIELGRFIFSANLPFKVVKNEKFAKFVKSLNPAYNLPSDVTVGSTILDKVYGEVIEGMKIKLNGKIGVLLQDGWSTQQNDPVISHCLYDGNDSHFLCSENPGIESPDAKFCFELAEKAMERAETEFNCTVVGFVTDNCNTMLSMQKMIREKYPEVAAYGCHAHLFDLLGEKFTSKELMAQVRTVHTYMRNNHKTKAMLDNLQAKRPVLAGATRWNSQIDSFKNYMENHTKYLEVIRKIQPPKEKSDLAKFMNVQAILNNPEVYKDLKTAVKILEPISIALDKLQRENSTLADAIKCWIDVRKNIPEEYREHEYFKKQQAAAFTNVALSTYIMDPRYQGKDLETEEREKGYAGIESKNLMFIVVASQINNPTSHYFYTSFQNEAVFNAMTPLDWWQAAATVNVPPGLIEFVRSLFVLPASTGSLERCFSTMGSIMTKTRNRLEVETASKLCTVTNYFKLKDEKLGGKVNTPVN